LARQSQSRWKRRNERFSENDQFRTSSSCFCNQGARLVDGSLGIQKDRRDMRSGDLKDGSYGSFRLSPEHEADG
jgi:hypothetical protein